MCQDISALTGLTPLILHPSAGHRPCTHVVGLLTAEISLLDCRALQKKFEVRTSLHAVQCIVIVCSSMKRELQ